MIPEGTFQIPKDDWGLLPEEVLAAPVPSHEETGPDAQYGAGGESLTSIVDPVVPTGTLFVPAEAGEGPIVYEQGCNRAVARRDDEPEGPDQLSARSAFCRRQFRWLNGPVELEVFLDFG